MHQKHHCPGLQMVGFRTPPGRACIGDISTEALSVGEEACCPACPRRLGCVCWGGGGRFCTGVTQKPQVGWGCCHQGGGGVEGTVSLELQTPDSVSPQPSLTILTGLQPPVIKVSKDSLLILLLLLWLSANGHNFSVFLIQVFLQLYT